MDPAPPCALILDGLLTDQQLLTWMMARTQTPTIEQMFLDMEMYTVVDGAFMTAFRRMLAETPATAQVPVPPTLPPHGPTPQAVLVYVEGKAIRVFPYVGELPYARLPVTCSMERLAELRQGVLCGSLDANAIGRRRFVDHRTAPPPLDAQAQARLEVNRCLLNLEQSRQVQRTRAPPLIRKAVRPLPALPPLRESQCATPVRSRKRMRVQEALDMADDGMDSDSDVEMMDV